MTDKNKPLDFSKVKTNPLAERPCKVHRRDYGGTAKAGKTVQEFIQTLPGLLT